MDSLSHGSSARLGLSFFKFVITGGPCAGKSSALGFLTQRLAAAGFAPFVVPEVATFFFEAGVDLASVSSGEKMMDFQSRLLASQLFLEDAVEGFARLHPGDSPIVLLCDRGALDSAAWMPPGAFARLAESEGCSVRQLASRYDAVFAMVTAADGAAAHYEVSGPRPEALDEAVALDRRIRAAWEVHPNVVIVSNRLGDRPVGFSEKLELLFQAVSRELASRQRPSR